MKKSHPRKGKGKYEYLLALNPGEVEVFDNKPSASEGRNKVNASDRLAYRRVSVGVSRLQREHPPYRFAVRIFTSPGSRLEGNKVEVKMLASGDASIADKDEFEASERRREASLRAWITRRQQEDAPKLPAQLEEARQQEDEKRKERAKARVIPAPKPAYDPVKLAELVLFKEHGGIVQKAGKDGWEDDPNPTWTLPTVLYRKKPRVREFFLIVGRNGDVTAAATSIDKLPHHDPACLVHARELTPEEES